MPFVDVEADVALHVQDVGAGRPVVLLAGFGLNHAVWDGTVLALAEANRVVCIDLRGTGRSDKPIRGYGIDRLTDDVVTVLDALDLRHVTLVGYSFGGQIALHVAAQNGERLAQLVLVCSNGVRASRSERFPFGPEPGPLQGALVRGERERRVATRRRTVRSAFAAEPDAGLLDWLLRQQLDMPSWAAIACYDTYLNTDLVDDLAAVRLPVLQIIGTEDPVTIAAGAPWVQERLSDGRLVAIEGCGHYPMFEARAAFDAALTTFVDQAN